MEFSFTPLGLSAAQPAYGRHLAAHILSLGAESFLIDCGEGTQFQMSAFGVKRGRLSRVFISHLHGDHFFGLIGLLTSLGMNDRRAPLYIYAPPGLEAMIRFQMETTNTGLPFDLHFQALQAEAGLLLIWETERLEAYSFPLEHRAPTTGFLFREKAHPLNIIPEAIEEYGISFEQIRAVKRGEDLTLADGRVVPNEQLTLPPFRPRSFAYCSDTAFSERSAEFVRGVDLLYHESTFLEQDADLAAETFHSTAAQAARVAQLAGAKTLVLGHFSARYPDDRVFLEEAVKVFPNAILGKEGEKIEIPLSRDFS
jgi:ribonuclease Z